MKKIILSLVGLVFVLGMIGIINADVVSAKNSAKNQKQEFSLPEHAAEVAPGVFYLGKALDKGKIVEGYAVMIKDKTKYVKPETICGDGVCDPGENAKKCPEDCGDGEEPDTSSCYKFLAKGAKWKSVEPYVVNPTNDDGVNTVFITSNLADNIGKWETAANYNILGKGTSTKDILEADFNMPDDKNEVYFMYLGETNTIAFVVVWGVFGGPPFARELVEWDMVFNDAFTWSKDATGSTTEMDFENIATHELGHAVGLGDLYNPKCSTQTMYGYSWNGDTQKRDLELGDIAGIQALYG